MGIFWELMQENRIKEQQVQAKSLEERVELLENELSICCLEYKDHKSIYFL